MSRCYTTKEIADAVDLTARAIHLRLQGVSPSGFKVINKRQRAHAYTIASLPTALRLELEQLAREKHFRDVAALLENRREEYRPARSLSDCHDDDIADALKLRTAQEEPLRRRNDLSLSPEEFNQLRRDAHRRAFGHAPSDRYILELFTRTLKRAGSSEDFSRVELYLADRLKAKVAEKQNLSAEIPELKTLLTETLRDPVIPVIEKREIFWEEALNYFDECLAVGESEKEVRRRLLEFTSANAGWIAASAEALEKGFRRKLEKRRAGEWIEDKRRLPKKLPRAGMSEAGWNNAVYLSGRYENIELAWREWRVCEKTPAEDKARFKNASAWRAPKIWREAVKHEAKLVSLAMRGPRTYKLNSAHMTRDPDSLASGDSDQSDDLTLPLIWWDELPDGEIFCGQGQVLVWVDERSWMYYNAMLIPDGAYNGFHIRNSWTNKAEKWFLPRKRIHVERGIWKSAKVFVGSRDQVGTHETQMGLRRLGIEFRHSTLPRGKIIERTFGSLQDLLQREPGYAGRNQMLDRFEAVHKNLALVKSGKEHPSKFFLSKSQVMDRLNHFGEKLNNTPKFGEYHKGRTPKEVYEERFTTPLVQIPDVYRYLLADNKIETPVGRNGITFRFGSRTFNYKNYRTGQLRGQRVIAWFSPERPDLLGVTDLKGEEPFVVRRSTLLSHEATDEQMAQANRENSAHNAYGKELLRALKPNFSADFLQRMVRPTVVDEQARETTMEFNLQKHTMLAQDAERRQLTTKASRASQKVGFPVAPERLRDEGVADDLEFLNEWKKGKK